MELKATNHGYGQNTYHLVFVPKYRYKMFRYEGIKKICKQSFYATAYKYGFTIHALEIMDDHVHLFVDFNPCYSVSKVVQLLKGISAHNIFSKVPYLKRKWYYRGHFWSAGKFYRSVGNVTADTIQNYIEQSQGSWTFKDTVTSYRNQHQTKLSV